MAIEVELPDGNVVEFPDGTDNGTMERALAQYKSAASADFTNVRGSVDTTANTAQDFMGNELARTPWHQKALAGAGQSVDSSVRGIKQAFTDSMQAQAGAAFTGLRSIGLDGAAIDIAQRIGLPLRGAQQRQTAEADEAKRIDAPLLSTGAGLLGNAAGHIAQLAVPVGEVGALTKGVGLLGRAAASIPTGAALGAIAPVASDESRGMNAAIGGALGPSGELLGAGLGGLAARSRAAIDPIKARAIQLAQQQGIPLHISQISNSIPVKTLASAAKYLPFSGAGKAATKQQEAFNQAVGRTFGSTAKKFDDDAVDAARRNLSNEFENIYNRNNVPIGAAELAALKNVADTVKSRLTVDQSSVIDNQLAAINQELAGSSIPGSLTGQKYQALRTQIMKAEDGDKVGRGVAELRKELDNIAASAVGPQDAAALKTLRSQWSNFRNTQKALGQIVGASGDVRPASLWPIVKNGSTKELRELARLGQVVLKDPIPDSGTPGRLIAGSLLSGGGGAAAAVGGTAGIASAALPLAGLLAGGATIGRALNSPAIARIAAAQPGAQALGLLGRLASPTGLVLANTASPVAAGEIRRRKKRNDD